MAHEQTIRIVPGAKIAVLMMHGIAGTPDHFRTLLPLEHLIRQDWTLCNILIEGHGKTVEDFAHSSMDAWRRQTMNIFEQLCREHEKVILIGHSMGTLFAMDMARAHPDKVAFLLLIEVPLRVGIKPFGARNLLRYAFGTLDPANPVQEAVTRVCSIPPTKQIWRYILWLPRMIELIRYMHASTKPLLQLQNPTFAWQSETDELVSNRSAKLLRASGTVEVFDFHSSTHFYYSDVDIAAVQQQFLDRCNQMNFQ